MTAAETAFEEKPDDHEIERVGRLLEKAAPETVLLWALQRFGKGVALATGFGAEGCVLVHMLSGIEPNARVFYLDTDLLFPETYDLRDRLQARYSVRFERQEVGLSLEEQAKIHGEKLWETDPDRCCDLRKVQPLKNVLSGLDAWITAVRRDQTPDRADAKIVERDKKFGLVKINPLARWTSKDVWRFIVRNDVPYNPLHDRGFPSIGCRPCTTLVQIGEGQRSGRWRGTAKTECGLHR
jgi:phosphoadenosine phosphosulfate reductase